MTAALSIICQGIITFFAVGWLIGLRAKCRAGEQQPRGNYIIAFLFLVSAAVFLLTDVSPLHVLWVLPVSVFVGMAAGTGFPLLYHVLWPPAYLYARLFIWSGLPKVVDPQATSQGYSHAGDRTDSSTGSDALSLDALVREVSFREVEEHAAKSFKATDGGRFAMQWHAFMQSVKDGDRFFLFRRGTTDVQSGYALVRDDRVIAYVTTMRVRGRAVSEEEKARRENQIAQFSDAVRTADVATVVSMLQANKRLAFVRDERGWTPLHLVAAQGTKARPAHGIVANFLIEAGADVHARDISGNTPLHLVAFSPSRALVPVARVLLDRGADPLLRNDGQMSATFVTRPCPEIEELITARVRRTTARLGR